MKVTWNIAKAELQTLFFSPLAWLVMVVFGIMVFGSFYDKFDLLVRTQELGDNIGHATRELFIDRNGIYAAMLQILYFFFPLLTMGLISRELGSGSIKLLDSSPVSTLQIVLGKYLCMCVFSLLLIVILFIPVVLGIFTIPHLEMKAIFTGLLGMYLLMCTYSAIGLFMSSLSTYPIVAAVGTLGVLAALNLVGTVWQEYDFMRDITYWLSISNRIVSFLTGIIASADVIYYLLIIILCVTLTWLKLRFAKLSCSIWKKTSIYASLVLVTIALGYISSLPQFRFYADGTEDKRNTLSEASQQIMENVKGKVTVTTYVNVLHKNSTFMMPVSINADKSRYEQYMRFHPEMELDYVYYYANTGTPSQTYQVYGILQGDPIDSVAYLVCNINGLDRDELLTAEQVNKTCSLDLAAEDYPVIKTISIEGKGTRPLRLFDDMMVLPSETEISAAFKGMTADVPTITYLAGNGTFDISSRLRLGYDAIFNMPTIRGSLINQGFRTERVDVQTGTLPPETDILVIANPTEPYTDAQLKMVHDYIRQGGNLLLMGDVDNNQIMNDIVAPLGITFTRGYIVEPHGTNSEVQPNVAVCEMLDAALTIDHGFSEWKREKLTLPMKMATEIRVDSSLNTGFRFIPLFQSAPNSWIKQEKANLLSGELKPDPAKGEQQGSRVTVAALTRILNGKEQRVLVTGDADWLTNINLSTQYPGIKTNPFGLATNAMSWMAYGEAPVKPVRAFVQDTCVNYRDIHLEWIYYLYVWLLPLAIAIAGFMLYQHRNKQ